MLKKLSLFTALLLFSFAAAAQNSFSSLEEMWKYADTHNITIRNAGYELDKVTYAKKQSYLAFLPQVAATGSFTDNTSLQTTLVPAVIFGGPADTYQPVQFGQKYIYTAGFTAQMDILNLQTWYNTRIVKETEELNKASVGNAKKTAYQQIATQYYAWLLNTEAARLAALSESIADSVLMSVNNKFNTGTVSLASVDMAKLNKERAGQTRITAEYQLQTTKNILKGLLGLSIQDSLSVNATLRSDSKDGPAAIFAEDPAVRQASYQSKVSLSTYKAANATIFPTLSVIYSNTTQQNNNTFEPFRGTPAWYPAQYWSLRASWNIFTGGTRWLQAQKNKISYYESKLQYENAQKQSAIYDENLRLSYDKANALLTKAENIMNLSFNNYTHISNKYNEGLSSIDERLNAFTDYLTYQNQYLNTYSDMLVQLYLLKIRQQSF